MIKTCNFMSKNDYTRSNFRSSLLKQIIIRIDYSGLTDLNGFVRQLKSTDWLQTLFTGYRLLKTNNINFEINPETVEKKLVPIEINEAENIHRFNDCSIQPLQEVTMDISQNFICLTIKCNNNYDTIDAYIKSVKQTVEALQDYDSYINLNRIAIRKVNGKDFSSIESVYQTFEVMKYLEKNIIQDVNPKKKRYTDSFLSKESNLKVNFTRALKCFKDDNGDVIRFVLDIDCYADSFTLSDEKVVDAGNVLVNINEELFKLFKASVTENFLSEGRK